MHLFSYNRYRVTRYLRVPYRSLKRLSGHSFSPLKIPGDLHHDKIHYQPVPPLNTHNHSSSLPVLLYATVLTRLTDPFDLVLPKSIDVGPQHHPRGHQFAPAKALRRVPVFHRLSSS